MSNNVMAEKNYATKKGESGFILLANRKTSRSF